MQRKSGEEKAPATQRHKGSTAAGRWSPWTTAGGMGPLDHCRGDGTSGPLQGRWDLWTTAGGMRPLDHCRGDGTLGPLQEDGTPGPLKADGAPGPLQADGTSGPVLLSTPVLGILMQTGSCPTLPYLL